MKPHRPPRLHQRGLTLVELLVAMAISLIVTLAITNVIIIGESQKRATSATNEMNQSGNYAAYVLDRAIRSAGSGFTQSWNYGAFGCVLNVARGGTKILPRANAFDAPFADMPKALRVAPVLLHRPAAGSDVLLIMGGNAATGDIGRPLRTSVASDELLLDNTVGLENGDIALLSRNGVDDCVLEQISSSTADLKTTGHERVALGGTFSATASADTSPLTTALNGPDSFLSPLGRVGASNLALQMWGVNDKRALVSYDLLQSKDQVADTAAMQAIADGVVELRALYGVDENDDGKLDNWVAPDSSGYELATMMGSADKVRRVMAIRIALLLRSNDYTRPKELEDGSLQHIAASQYVLFKSMPEALQSTVAVPTEGQDYRHRIVELTVPLRNALLLPPPNP